MPERTTVEHLIARLKRGIDPPLLAIDGLPCAGKSTLVQRLAQRPDLHHVQVDDFSRPEHAWRGRPAFPFPFTRHGEFRAAVRALATTGTCRYRRFNWETLTVPAVARTVTLDRLVAVEGVGALDPVLAPFYGLRVFVDSDRTSVITAAIARGDGQWETQWRDLFLPSTDLYMQTRPRERADLALAGRGIDA